MLKDITFGQYIARPSVVHRMDARAKLLLLILMIVFLFLAKSFWGLLLFAAFLFGGIAASRISLRYFLKNIKAIWMVLALTAVINLFYETTGKTLWTYGFLRITTGGIYKALFMAIRIMLLILVSALLTYTTTPNDLTDGLERLLMPLKWIGLGTAVHTLSMMMTIALRFIPTLVEETERIMNAQKARGADLENGSLLRRIKALIPILIPLLVSAIRRAYELAEAMECRCYNGGVGRTRMKQLHLALRDFYATVVCVGVCVGIILLNGVSG